MMGLRNRNADAGTEQGCADDLSWLVGTYWYVPTDYLPAMQQVNIAQPQITQVNDQTLWYFTQYSNGYLIGQCAASIDGGDFEYQSIVGSVAPDGSVCLSFTPVGGISLHPVQGSVSVASFIVGQGKLTQHQGQPAFLMQMTGGNGAYNLTHWAYMMQTKPGDESWTTLPGTDGSQSVEEVFADWG